MPTYSADSFFWTTSGRFALRSVPRSFQRKSRLVAGRGQPDARVSRRVSALARELHPRDAIPEYQPNGAAPRRPRNLALKRHLDLHPIFPD